MMTRRTLLAGLAARRKPNLLFIISDDHAAYVMGCDGNKRASTPNLDRLAREGVRFAQHYCNQPVCTPSRQSLLTGLLPSAAGVTVLQTSLDPARPNLAKRCREAGYKTAVFGKMHLNRPSSPGLYGFETMMAEREINQAWSGSPVLQPAPAGVATKPPWKPFRDPARIWLNGEKLPYPRYYDEMRGTFTARQATRWMEEHREEPFALWVSFPDPHSPFDFPIDMAAQFPAASFAVPRVGPEDAGQIPLIFRNLSPEDKQGIQAAYYTSVAMLDRNVGEVLDTLRRLNLEDDTLVVYLADHGYCIGQHGRFEKHCGYEPALRVPLIIRFPGRARRGATVEALTEHVDVTATLADMLGLGPLPGQHGTSLRPHLEGKKAPGRTHITSQYLENEEAFLSSPDWKFIHCSGKRKRGDGYETDRPTPGRYIRLYDRKRDPGEFTDVAAKYPEVVRQMQDLVLKRYRATHPDAAAEPTNLPAPEAIDFYVRPRDA
ncbi:MAG: sulfatase [Acidobacteriota bacterium]|jgi:arylsulfatase A-like enzyme|nr:sulfatase-like hydrolase/transferase [Acidobacteriaceae bacterium]